MTIRGNDYWALTEKERGALTRDEVATYQSYELMRRGCLEPDPLVLVTVPDLKLATAPYYRIRYGTYDKLNAVFETEAEARAVVNAKPLLVESAYLGDTHDFVVRPEELRIECVELPSKEAVDAARVTLKEIGEAKAENERRHRAHAEQTKAVEAATRGLWQDWHESCAKATKVAKLASTFEKYVGLAGGDVQVAARFLRQAFPFAEIKEAEAWTGRDFGGSQVEAMPEPPVVADTSEAAAL